MSLHQLPIPDTIKSLPYSSEAEQLIDGANEAIEAFMLSDDRVIENFVTCDFHLLDQALTWIEHHHLLTGDRFCEWGSGFSVGALLAALRGMKSVGIEIEPRLVDEANQLADVFGSQAKTYCDSFVPRDVAGLEEVAAEVKNVDTGVGDVYDDIGLTIDDFDLFFAFPWPGEHGFFEHVFAQCAADGALLLTYRGRDGMNLVRKVAEA